MTLKERFYSKIKPVDGPDGLCFEWQGSLDNKGYGRIQVNFGGKWKNTYAHRVAWFLTTGTWPEKNLCHNCDNPKCVRYAHLFEGTQLENIQDCISKGRAKYKVVEVCKRGHNLTGDNLYFHSGKKHCKTCRREWKRQARQNGKY